MLPKPIWLEEEKVFLIDQTKLPTEMDIVQIKTAQQMWDAIQRLMVRAHRPLVWLPPLAFIWA